MTDTTLNILPSNEPSKEFDRRSFLKRFGSALAGVTLIGSLPAILESCGTTVTDVGPGTDAGHTLVTDVSSLTSNNSGIHTTAPISGRPLIVIRRSATTYETLLLVCPHAGCAYPDVDLQGTSITCRCHDSVFSITGSKVSGPSNAGLTSFATTYNDTTKKVTITF